MIKIKIFISVLVFSVLLSLSMTYASTEVKHASTRMLGCEENDIVMWDKVRAACNSDYNSENSEYYKGKDKDSVDINWWNYGRLYQDDYASCPALYKLPSLEEFTASVKNFNHINVLKLSAWWSLLIYRGEKIYRRIDQQWVYVVSDYSRTNSDSYDRKFFQFNLNNWVIWKTDWNSAWWASKLSLRCLRVAPATQEEKFGKLTVVEQENTINYGIGSQTNFGIATNQEFETTPSSTDEYVNAKLDEINECFVETYSGQLANIVQTIKTLTETKNKTTDASEKKKYEKAISKLTEIKNLFIKKYGFLLGNSSTSTGMTPVAMIPKKWLIKWSFVIDPSLDKKEYMYDIVFDAKNTNHIYALLLIMSDLHSRWYSIDMVYSTINKVFVRKTGKTFAQAAIKIKTWLKNKAIAEKIKDVKEILEWVDGDDAWILDGFEFGLGDNVGNKKIGYGDVMGNGAGGIMDDINWFLDELNKSRNGFGNTQWWGYNDTYGGDTAWFNDTRGQNMAWGFDEVVGYSTNVKESNNGSYRGSHFQYRSVNGSDGSFRQWSKRSIVDNKGNTTLHERVVVNNTDGTTEVYEWTTTNNSRSGVYTKTDSDGNVIEEKHVTGTPADNNWSAPWTSDTDEPTGSINPESDNGGMAPWVFIGLLGLLNKSAFVNSFNGGNWSINRWNGDNAQEWWLGGLSEVKVSGWWTINWWEDYCEVCQGNMWWINPGAYKAGQVTNRWGR